MQHTPEPWVKDNFDILGPKGETLLVGMHRDERGSLDLKRAVACVNACAGIEDPIATLAAIREALSAIVQPLGDETETSGNPCIAPNPTEGRAIARVLKLITPKP